MTVYLDCNATTPVEPRVVDEMVRFFRDEYGNAGSRTHEYGTRASQAVQRAREQVAAVVKAEAEDVIFTSGATESNNLAILGLATHGEKSGRRHIVSTAIEHKAVLEPLQRLGRQGFDVTLVRPTPGGWVDPADISSALRTDTLIVSVMHVNNETGVSQPLAAIAEVLQCHPAYFHVDAAQGFGKELSALQHPRLDLISISGHKIFGPKGIGALVARRRGFVRPPLTALFVGGGQEGGLRSGTLPVPLIVGLGLAAEFALAEAPHRVAACSKFRQRALDALASLEPVINGDPDRTLPHVLNISLPGIDSEAAMVSLKALIAVSNGSACTSQDYQPSHVLTAMGLPDPIVRSALRISWSHMTEDPDWEAVVRRLRSLR